MNLCRWMVWAVAAAGCVRAQCDGTEPVTTTIPVTQSGCVGRVVTVTGVVTLASRPLGGFWIQDAAGDNNVETSDGIFVFQSAQAAAFPEPGALVRVTGRVTDFARAGNPGALRQIDIRPATSALGRLETIGAAPLPAATVLDPQDDGSAGPHFRARLGMRVSYPMSAVVGPANNFGEFYALRFDRLPAQVRQLDGQPGMGLPLLIDDTGDAFRQRAKVYDLVPAMTGTLHFDFGAYRLEPDRAYGLEDGGWTPVAAPALAGTLRVASMNVERLVPTLAAAARETKIDKLARAIQEMLQAPDIIAVEEIGSAELLAELGRRAGGYESVWLKSCDFSGIALGVLWKPDRATQSNARLLQAEAPEFRNGRCALDDGRTFTQYLFDRPSLAVDFRVGSLEFTLVVNHWRSQIGGNEPERLAGARFLAEEIEKLGERAVIAVGDFNDTEASAPLAALAPLENLSLRLAAEDRYSLLFQGRSQAFDHVLVSPSLAGRVVAQGYAHYNADFPSDGNAANRETAVRSADHDVPWVALRVP